MNLRILQGNDPLVCLNNTNSNKWAGEHQNYSHHIVASRGRSCQGFLTRALLRRILATTPTAALQVELNLQAIAAICLRKVIQAFGNISDYWKIRSNRYQTRLSHLIRRLLASRSFLIIGKALLQRDIHEFSYHGRLSLTILRPVCRLLWKSRASWKY